MGVFIGVGIKFKITFECPHCLNTFASRRSNASATLLRLLLLKLFGNTVQRADDYIPRSAVGNVVHCLYMLQGPLYMCSPLRKLFQRICSEAN
jgi:hypothetical protein